MKKLLSLLTVMAFALPMMAVGTASDPYLSVSKYATIDEAGATVDGMETIYKYTQAGSGYWLTLSNYGVMMTDETQNWFTNEITDADTGTQYTNAWTATDVFQGPSAYFGSNPAYSAKYKQPVKKQTFYVTFCTQVKQYAYHRSNSSYYIFKMEIFECTKNADGTITEGTTPIETLQNSVIGTEVLTSQELDPEKVYKVVLTNQYSYLYEIAFKTPGEFDGEVISPVAYDATNVGEHTVTCTWSPCLGAKSYTVRIVPAEYEGLVYREKFTNFTNGQELNDWQSLDAYTDHPQWMGHDLSGVDGGIMLKNNGFLQSPYSNENAIYIQPFQKKYTLKFKAKLAEGVESGQLNVISGANSQLYDITSTETDYTFVVDRSLNGSYDTETYATFNFINPYWFNPYGGGEEEDHRIILTDVKVYLGDYSQPHNGTSTKYIQPQWDGDIYLTANVTDTTFAWGPNPALNYHYNAHNALYYYDVKSVYYDGQESEWSNKIYYVWGEKQVILEDDDEPVVGDVNGDGSVNTLDITVLYNFILSGDTQDLVNGDQDGDGAINTTDVTIVYNILLGM